jgi:hypothetical protein
MNAGLVLAALTAGDVPPDHPGGRYERVISLALALFVGVEKVYAAAPRKGTCEFLIVPSVNHLPSAFLGFAFAHRIALPSADISCSRLWLSFRARARPPRLPSATAAAFFRRFPLAIRGSLAERIA